jgi:hypothetical protein
MAANGPVAGLKPFTGKAFDSLSGFGTRELTGIIVVI